MNWSDGRAESRDWDSRHRRCRRIKALRRDTVKYVRNSSGAFIDAAEVGHFCFRLCSRHPAVSTAVGSLQWASVAVLILSIPSWEDRLRTFKSRNRRRFPGGSLPCDRAGPIAPDSVPIANTKESRYRGAGLRLLLPRPLGRSGCSANQPGTSTGKAWSTWRAGRSLIWVVAGTIYNGSHSWTVRLAVATEEVLGILRLKPSQAGIRILRVGRFRHHAAAPCNSLRNVSKASSERRIASPSRTRKSLHAEGVRSYT